MKIFNACNFGLNGYAGNVRQAGIKSIQKHVDRLRVFSTSAKFLDKVLSIPIVEFKYIRYLLADRPDIFNSKV